MNQEKETSVHIVNEHKNIRNKVKEIHYLQKIINKKHDERMEKEIYNNEYEILKNITFE